jgi:hypothetical protein
VTASDLERALGRRASPYTSSHELEEVDVELADGSQLELVLKSQAVLAGARDAKPGFLVDAGREERVYESALPAIGDAAPAFYGVIGGSLVLERVAASPLTESGDWTAWERAMRRIAQVHDVIARTAVPDLILYDAAFYERWLTRAEAFEAAVEALAPAHQRATSRLLELDAVLIHGELYASNVLVAEDRVCFVDWETAAFGPAEVDVAALTSGSWSDDEREQLALAYHDSRVGPPKTKEEFLLDVACARLHLAVQWLGWSQAWTPPPEQAQDWLSEAHGAAALVP